MIGSRQHVKVPSIWIYSQGRTPQILFKIISKITVTKLAHISTSHLLYNDHIHTTKKTLILFLHFEAAAGLRLCAM